MNDILLLYLFTRASAIQAVLGTCAFVALMIGGVCFGGGLWDKIDGAIKWGRRVLIVGCVLVVVAVLTPSTKDIAIIVGGKAALDVARSEPVNDTMKKAVELLRLKIDEELQKEKK